MASMTTRETKEANYYEMLGVPKYVSAEEIKRRYRNLVLKFHRTGRDRPLQGRSWS